jgi:hypothetical protein
MLNRKEIISILLALLILTFSITLVETWQIFLEILIIVFIILAINIASKKIISYYLDSEIEIKLWEIMRFGFKPKSHFKRPFPAGAFFPVISKIFLFPLKNFVWMASLVFDVKPKKYHTAKRHGLYTFSEMTEAHIGLIAAAGIFMNLIFAVIGYFSGFDTFARLSIYFCLFNMIPLSDLDGNKIFFGNLVIWGFLAALTLIGILFAIFVV